MNRVFFGFTHLGLHRENNEDLFGHVEDKQFFALADGMGGHLAGEVAAFHAIRSLCTKAKAELPLSLEKTCLFLRQSLAEANREIFNLSAAKEEFKGMGTTLSCFVLQSQYLIYGHIGDSRLYRYRNEKLARLTQDHSLRQSKIQPSLQQKVKYSLTKALGSHHLALPDIGVSPLHIGDLYMLCSDGLSDYINDAVLQDLLKAPLPLKEKGEMLIQAALEKGGRDNISLLLVQILPFHEKDLFRQQRNHLRLSGGRNYYPGRDSSFPG
ncbi:MAG: hypothetical protein RLZZ453_1310 [Chlamydiota bacterium]|jgi:protein phosphatase